MWSHIATASISLAKRVATTEEPSAPNYNLPAWAIGLLLLVFVVFLFPFLFTTYTLKTVFPVLAIIENPNPPSYEAVANDEHDDTPASTTHTDGEDAHDETGDAAAAVPITSSLKRTFRIVRSAGGMRSSFRGLYLAVVIAFAVSAVSGIVGAIPFIPTSVAVLLATLSLVQLHVAWVHAVIRTGSTPRAFWRNLPPFRRTFEATSLPVFLSWVASAITMYIPLLVGNLLGLPSWSARTPNVVPVFNAHMIWKVAVAGVIQLALVFLLVIPATVVLVRVQASLLPPDEDTIVPFDRSFGGAVEPLIVSGRGYATVRDAYRTFSRASWKRLLILYTKVYLVSIAFNLLLAAVVIPIFVLAGSKGVKTPSN
ncbi:hypothetical protein CMQ_1021 [Grosmannia clavigera kw1407]|uniref:Ubiquitin carrier protein n=1 Tax=Grosmannia clavigera (strain kw1407 / UAMH 11150) TaxID=655863 RepID=F0XFW2_GROCL|nr:uncharacterized protein CMQ_1021 [Grosmannia clavigera kw1407]EFX04093.1 hypothetical protein CMQ_1021 [Grosmannia clavigera kw1407]